MAFTLAQTININASGATTSLTMTYGSTPTVGNLLVAGLSARDATAIQLPSGWTWIGNSPLVVSGQMGAAFCYKISAGTESTVQFTWTTSGNCRGFCLEMDQGYTLDQTADDNVATEAGSQTSGTTGTQSASNNEALAFFATETANNSNVGRSYSNSYTEMLDMGTGTIATCNLAELTLSGTGTTECTFSWTGGSCDAIGFMSTWTPDASTSIPIFMHHYRNNIG